MKNVFFILTMLGAHGCFSQEIAVDTTLSSDRVISIAFGSCGHQNDPQPVLRLIADKNPDLFIYLGDNIYSDTYSMDTLSDSCSKAFQTFSMGALYVCSITKGSCFIFSIL